ncbi:hypothetical protein BWQ96_07575 [Gracilariopsis chorda]|uniref:Uncharacterized protein n=1 Tax=Gracilariopsis chorda TaxID=448386 RepID=A0A2V3IKX3_9FLOR|nr:hypothetical protein BWQ96_07575 [Gracilariopsis chorda]|eukprot:PXF42689.1 hypothetical protein BWQ96_07575 [Gracilariopsis chorda]
MFRFASMSCALFVLLFAAPIFCCGFRVCPSSSQVLQYGKCYRSCIPGFEGQGATCAVGGSCNENEDEDRNEASRCRSYIRGNGVNLVVCSPSSFNRGLALTANHEQSFSMIILNDPQLVWWQDPRGGEQCKGEETCKQENAEKEALHQVRAMNAIHELGVWPGSGEAISRPVGVIINGDLTQYFHPREFDLFERYYVLHSNSPHKDVLRYDLYLGLGNHDYANNVADCGWIREFQYLLRFTNGCAQKAVDTIKGMISCNTSDSFPATKVQNFDSGSLAYSWDHENYHFIQLHNYPTYEASSIGISSSMEWLEEDLKLAVAAKRKIIVNLHDLGDHFHGSGRNTFFTMLKNANVLAIFCGHVISNDNVGFQGNIGSIPVFRGGHGGEVNRNRFLLVRFAPTYLRVIVVSSFGGVPRFEKVGDDTYDKTVYF